MTSRFANCFLENNERIEISWRCTWDFVGISEIHEGVKKMMGVKKNTGEPPEPGPGKVSSVRLGNCQSLQLMTSMYSDG